MGRSMKCQTDLQSFKKAGQHSSVQKETQIKLNQIKYNQIYFLELNITM